MYTIMIIEDDPASAKVISEMLKSSPCAESLEVSTKIIGDCFSEQELLEGDSTDIAIVDIELGLEDGRNGIDLAESANSSGKCSQVIFVTGHINYCTDVYKTDHVSFLVKPFSQENLNTALSSAISNLERCKTRKLAVRFGRTTKYLDIDSIEYAESRRRRVTVHTGDESAVTYDSLDVLSEKLPHSFYRCHKSFIVNMPQIDHFEPDFFVVKSGARVPISRAHKKEALDKVTRYLTWMPAAGVQSQR